MNKLTVVSVPTVSTRNLKSENNVGKVGFTYQQRKSMQPMYSDLFKALLRLPDKQVQQRVLDAINDVQVLRCPKCDYTFQNVDVAAPTEHKLQIPYIKDKVPLPLNSELGVLSKPVIRNSNITFNTPIKIVGNLKMTPADAMVPPLIQQSNAKRTKLDENDEPKKFIKPVPIEKLMEKSRLLMEPSIESGLICNFIATIKTDKSEVTSEDTEMSDKTIEKVVVPEIVVTNEESQIKRKRKRKERIPQVIKKSHALIAQSKMVPKLKKRKMNLEKVKNYDQPSSVDSFEDQNIPYINNVLTFESDTSNSSTTSKIDYILKTMTKQLMVSETMEDGLLPIHHAICKSDDITLKQHIFIWTKFKQVDLNTLYTDDGKDLLQLAITYNSNLEIIEILLNNNINVQTLTDDSNTVIHLAITNEVHIQTFSLLMEKIDLMLLNTLNDDGLSPLHLALRSNQFSYAEVMLNTVDKRLMGCIKYCRNEDFKKSDPIDYYFNMCEKMDEKYVQEILKHTVIDKLLNAREMTTGNTALFYAVGKNMENFIYFLLAHAANPNVQNYSGQDPRSFLGDHGKLLNISLKVDRTMEKISKVIKKYQK